MSARVPSWSTGAWCAIAIATAFFLLTVWWLTQDRAVPYGDTAEELWVAFRFRDYLLHGHIGAILDRQIYYPPYGLMLGGLSAIVGGIERNVVVLGMNVVCVPLLALSCYRIGRRVGGPSAGALAVLFAFGSPLLIEQFHVFIIDVQEATLVALSVCLVLESERFARLGFAVLAGLAVGIGTGTKEQFPLYVAAFLAVVVARGGWRNVRGLAAFAAAAVVVGSPWYIFNSGAFERALRAADNGKGALFPVPPLARPPLLSVANFEWYWWATLNGLLFAPLTAFALAGVGSAVWRLRARDARAGVLPELAVGLAGAWLALTMLFHKDMRYTLPTIVFVAVLGSAWIVRLPRRARAAVAAGLAAAVVASTLGMTFGVGGRVPDRLPGNLGVALGVGVPPLHRVVVYANHDYLVSGPRRDADVLSMLRGLHRIGVRKVYWDPGAAGPEHGEFNGAGLSVLARIAGIEIPDVIATNAILPHFALLMYQPAPSGYSPCVRFHNGMGIWVLLGRGHNAVSYCPGRGVTGTPIPVPAISQGQPGSTNLR